MGRNLVNGPSFAPNCCPTVHSLSLRYGQTCKIKQTVRRRMLGLPHQAQSSAYLFVQIILFKVLCTLAATESATDGVCRVNDPVAGNVVPVSRLSDCTASRIFRLLCEVKDVQLDQRHFGTAKQSEPFACETSRKADCTLDYICETWLFLRTCCSLAPVRLESFTACPFGSPAFLAHKSMLLKTQK